MRNLGCSGDDVTTRLRSKNFGTPDEWLSGEPAPDRRLQRESLRRHQHQGGRHLRVLRLQRVVRRAGGSGAVQEAARRLDHAHARAEVQREVGAARRALFADRARKPAAIPTCPTAGRTTSGWRSTRRRWRRSRRPTACASSICSRRAATLYAQTQAAADDQRRAPEQRGQPPDRRGHRSRPVRRCAGHKERTWRSCGRRWSTRDFYWFNRYRTTDGFATYGDRAFLTFIRGNPRNVNAAVAAKAGKENVLPTNYEVLQRESTDPRRDDRQPRSAHLGHRARLRSENRDDDDRRRRHRRADQRARQGAQRRAHLPRRRGSRFRR